MSHIWQKGNSMKKFEWVMNRIIPVSLSDKFKFRCRQCGNCCRHVQASVPLESLDAFRLAKYLRDNGHEDIKCIDDVLAIYASPVLLHKSGYTVFMLNTVGDDGACVFLKDNKCTVHNAKPRACRTYPISVGTDGHGTYEQYLSVEQPHHFKGPQISVKKWIRKRFSNQDQEFLNVDVGSAKELSQLLAKVPIQEKGQAMFKFLFYKYSNYDLDKSFIDQYKVNNQELIELLRKMIYEEPKN